MNTLLVFLGAGIGGVARYGINLAALRAGATFPWGTFAINVTGSLLMGLVTGWLTARGGSPGIKLFVATGILGGYTTFSTFSLDAFLLMERGDWLGFAGYVAGSVLLGLGALMLGLLAMRQIL